MLIIQIFRNIDITDLKIVGCDGTALNTGILNYIYHFLVVKLLYIY